MSWASSGRVPSAPLRKTLPANWPGFKVHYRYRETTYHITIKQTVRPATTPAPPAAAASEPAAQTITLLDDRQDHHLELHFNGESTPEPDLELLETAHS